MGNGIRNAQKIGIIGFGVVGKSVLNFLRLRDQKAQISIWDQRQLSLTEQEIITRAHAQHASAISLEKFFQDHIQVY